MTVKIISEFQSELQSEKPRTLPNILDHYFSYVNIRFFRFLRGLYFQIVVAFSENLKVEKI